MKKILYLSLISISWGFYKFYEVPGASMYVKTVGRSDQLGHVLIYIFAGIVILIMMSKRIILHEELIPKIAFSGSLGLTLLLYFLALVSSIYSFFPVYSAFRATQFIIAILTIAFVLDEQEGNIDHAKAVRIINYVLAANFIWLVIAYFAAPDLVATKLYTGGYRLIGGTLFHRDYGFISLCVGILSLCNALTHEDARKRKTYFILSILACIFVFLSRTRGAILCIPIVVILILFLLKKIDLKRFATIGTLITLLLIADHSLHIFQFIFRMQEGSLSTLSGRFVTWSYFLNEIPKVPIVGYGFLCTPFVTKSARLHHLGMSSDAHNAFLEVFYNLGYIGFLLFLLIIFKVFEEFYQCYQLRLIEKSEEFRILITKMLVITIVIFLSFFQSNGLMSPISFKNIYLIVIMGALQVMKYKKSE